MNHVSAALTELRKELGSCFEVFNSPLSGSYPTIALVDELKKKAAKEESQLVDADLVLPVDRDIAAMPKARVERAARLLQAALHLELKVAGIYPVSVSVGVEGRAGAGPNFRITVVGVVVD